MAWPRALLLAAAICVVGIGLLVYVPNIVLTRWTRLVHSARIAIATAWFFVALFGIAGALRYLQKRDLI